MSIVAQQTRRRSPRVTADRPAASRRLWLLRVVAMLLPSVFIGVVLIGLHLVEEAGPLGDEAEHAAAIAVLATASVPFAIYVFGSFARLRDELDQHRVEEAALRAHADERERIARDLHDDFGQLLGFLTAKIQATEELLSRGDVAGARVEMAGLEGASRSLAGQVRESILGMRVRIGPDRALGRALAEFVAQFGVQAGIATRFDGRDDTGAALSPTEQYQLLRITQECLSNVRRHSGAQTASVSLAATDRTVSLVVEDDGHGFEPAAEHSGFGLKTMAERARAIRGTFDVESPPGGGCRVTVCVPVGG